MVLLEANDVVAGYGNGPNILQGLSVNLEEGQTYCIVGPNGAGKSTFLKVLAGILHPRSGSMLFDGEEIAGLRPDQMLGKGVCFVPQDPSLFPRMTVRQNLTMGAFLESDRNVVRSRLDQVFTMFPILEERMSQPAGTLSGGQQQTLLMGRAMMIDPRLLLIDEPSLGLAPQIADHIFEVIGGLNDLGVTVLIVEQNVERGLDVSDWAFVFDLGTKNFEGPSESIIADRRIRDLYLGKLPDPGSRG